MRYNIMVQLRVLAIVLAGGKGTRLYPLTKERAKAAVPFGGRHLLIDCVLSNLVNSGIRSIYVLVQFRSQPLLEHLSRVWQFDNPEEGDFVIPVPAQMRSPDESWYQGTADAIYQNINLIEQANPDLVAIFLSDHVVRMDVRRMVEHHLQTNSEVTVAGVPVDKANAPWLGVIETSPDGLVCAFHEKNPHAPTMRGRPDRVHASMGNCIFSTRTLLRALYDDATDVNSSHDFGRDILPTLAREGGMRVFDFEHNRVPGEPVDIAPYWRDLGDIESYYATHMDVCGDRPRFNLFDFEWPIRGATFRGAVQESGSDEAVIEGQATSAVVSPGCRILGVVRNSVLGPGVRVHAGALVEESVLLESCDVGRRARVRRAILDRNVRLPEDAAIGLDLEHDRQFHYVTESGIVVVEGNRSPLTVGSVVV